ncbi:uncharacterized protein LOC122721545 [Manihot esculenta]|uniref:Embryo sac development arrest 6 n=1 Tax=Manihot esculenta TaxID=3983 RepID=A0A2C9UPY2_MANES|nr:uncharacterized protein LOC122721545 [Manihot esculenta]OAY32682.1 hypothetical protein MANES_13G037700v8 [Manihot esculenta]
MNTKTMRLPPRRVLTSNKRKERECFDSLKPFPPPTKLAKPSIPQVGSEKLPDPVSSNQLLAGYLAHEYLTKGTLFGQPWDPAGAEAVAGEPKKVKPSQKAKEEEAEPNKENYQRYVEVSSLLKAEGAHLPGVVNPSQLSRFLQMRMC